MQNLDDSERDSDAVQSECTPDGVILEDSQLYSGLLPPKPKGRNSAVFLPFRKRFDTDKSLDHGNSASRNREDNLRYDSSKILAKNFSQVVSDKCLSMHKG